MMRQIVLALSVSTFALVWGSAATAGAQSLSQKLTQAQVTTGPTLYEPQVDIRNGGVLDESYGYHRQAQANQSVRPGPYPPKGGWYGYGFPVSTYRWGWFGAERYYPRVGWRSDYYNNCVRFAYRYGY
jgi:hypothetical protein